MSVDEVSELIRQVLGTGAGTGTGAEIGPDSRLEADLQLESIDLLALDGLLRERHGEGVALCAHVAQLEFEAILALTVGDVAAYVAQARQ